MRLCGEFLRALGHRLLELGGGHHFIDEPPVHGALAFDALLGGAEHVGAIAAHLAFVGDAGEPAGAGKHGEQRQLRQRYRRGAVVDQHDVVGRKRQLVAAARGGAVDHANGEEARGLACVLDAVARLVGELAEIDLVGVAGAGEHANVGAGAEHLRMLEAQPLDGVRKLDVDAEVVGVELELVALEQRTLFVDVHQQCCDVAVDRKLPMAIFRRIGLEVDAALAVVQFAFCVGHGFPHNIIQRAELGCFALRPLAAARAGLTSPGAGISPS